MEIPAKKYEIDLHGFTKIEAKEYLKNLIDSIKISTEITIIHGYSKGNVLLNLVRKEFKHKKIIQKIVTLNDGETIYIVKNI